MRAPILVVGISFVLSQHSCKSRHFNTEGNAQTASFRADNRGSWLPLTTFRDPTHMFVDTSSEDGTPESGGWWVTPIHVTLLPESGNVLVTGWSRKDKNTCHQHNKVYMNGEVEKRMGSRRNGTSFVLNPSVVGKVGTYNLNPPLHEDMRDEGDKLYCAGHAPLSDGRVFYVGGATYDFLGDEQRETEYGLDYGRIFDPKKGKFVWRTQRLEGGPVFPPHANWGNRPYPPPPQKLRQGQDGRLNSAWYPTVTRLPDSKLLVSSGLVNCCNKADDRLNYFHNNAINLFDARANGGNGAFQLLVSHDASRDEIAPGMKDYTHTFLLRKPTRVGNEEFQLAMIGYKGKIVFFNYTTRRFADAPNGQRPARAYSPQEAQNNNAGAEMAWNSTAALLPSGEIMIYGGSGNNEAASRVDIFDPYAMRWRHIHTGIGRHNPASVLLPDGNVLITNGWADGQQVVGDRKVPVVINPDPKADPSEQVTHLSSWPSSEPERGYHSFALLLKDATVLIGGGTHAPLGNTTAEIGCEQTTARIFQPPYLKNGERPAFEGVSRVDLKIGGAPVDLKIRGGNLHAERGVALLAAGSTTHSFDQNQRYVELFFEQRGSELKIMPPQDSLAAPEGEYLLFLLSEKGVPSHGLYARVHR